MHSKYLLIFIFIFFSRSLLAQAPIISSFTPSSTGVGSTITISGNNFNSTAASNIVFFGAVKAAVSSASSTSLTVTVPAGASYKPISVLNTANGLTGYSSKPFVTTFATSHTLTASDIDSHADLSSGYGSSAVAVSDLDGDGKPDIVAANYASNTISILRNVSVSGVISPSSFAAKVDIATGTYPSAVAIADVDGDGKPDIVVANKNDNTISVYHNISATGSITASSFAARINFTTGLNPAGVAIADIDGDGKPEILVTNSGLNSTAVSVFANQSTTGVINNASFAAKMDFSVGANPSNILIADIDGDNKPDVIVTAYLANSSVYILRNTATAGSISVNSFATSVAAIPGSYLPTLAIGDIDNDGKPDIITSNYYSPGITVYRNTCTPGNITQAAFATTATFASNNSLNSIATGDVDGDGLIDVIAASSTTVSLYRNLNVSGNVTSGSLAAKIDFTASGGYSALVTDLDGDGRADMLVGGGSTGISILHNDPIYPAPVISSFVPASGNIGNNVTINGSNFAPGTTNNIVYFGATRATVTAASATQLTVTVPLGASYQPISVLNNSTHRMGYSALPFMPTFTTRNKIATYDFVPPVTAVANTLAVGDIDGDGKPDIVGAEFGNHVLDINRNISTSGNILAASFAAPVGINTQDIVTNAILFDVDNDGRLDIVVSYGSAYGSSSNYANVYRNTSTPGNISFDAGIQLYSNSSWGICKMAVADIDGDGKTDLISVPSQGGGAVSVFLNKSSNGVLAFANEVVATQYFSTLNNISVADIDGDGKPDIIVPSGVSSQGSVTVLRNTSVIGSVSIASGVDFPISTTVNTCAVGDIDGDGKPDIVVTTTKPGFTVLHNIATPGLITTGSFDQKTDFAMANLPGNIVLGDIDGDGKPDITMNNFNSLGTPNALSFYKNTATPGTINSSSFATGIDYISSDKPVAICDLDGDGKADVIGNTTILRNDPALHPAPVITSISPASGQAGTTVNIAGTNFNLNTGGNTVYFGSTKAYITNTTATQITAQVPSGSDLQPVTVLNNYTRLNSYSPIPFIPTFTSKTTIASSDFDTKVDFPATTPSSIFFGDIDGDGKPDLVTTCYGANSVTVCRNVTSPGYFLIDNYSTGFTGFPGVRTLTTGTGPVAVVVADVDNDGKLDIITVNKTSNTVSVFRNLYPSTPSGSFSFDAKLDFPTGSSPAGLSVGDIDGDGKVDIIVTNGAGNTISVLRNISGVGNIAFEPKVDFASGISPSGVVVNDLDGDGKTDIVVTNSGSNTISTYVNQSTPGSIALGSKVDFATGQNPLAVVAVDVDNDGKADIAVANNTDNTVSVLHNNSTSGSIALSTKVDFATGQSPKGLTFGYFDGDNKPELVTSNSASNTISVLHNNSSTGSITASSFDPKADISTGTNPSAIFACDMDGDGRPDISIGNMGNNTISLLRDDPVIPTGVNPPVITSFTPSTGTPGSNVTINGTGFNTSSSNNVVYFGATKATVNTASATQLSVKAPIGADYLPISVVNISNRLGAASNLPFVTTFSSKNSITTADFDPRFDLPLGLTGATNSPTFIFSDLDSDGRPDLIVSEGSANLIAVYRNISATGNVTAASFAPKVNITINHSPGSIFVRDMDGDGKPDIVAVTNNGYDVTIFKNSSSPGSISSSSFYVGSTITTTTGIAGIAIGDIDGDGRPDIVLANSRNLTTGYYGNIVSAYPNTSAGGLISFGTRADIFTGLSYASFINLADLDGDGKLDMVVQNQVPPAAGIIVLKNTSIPGNITTSSFAPAVTLNYTGSVFSPATIADIDGDGKPDIVIPNGSNVSVLRNQAVAGTLNASSFATSADFAVGAAGYALAIGDLDGDGKPDVATGNFSDNTTSVIRNSSVTGTVSFAPYIKLPTAANPNTVQINDVDGDGKPDLAVGNTNAVNQVSIYRSNPLLPNSPQITAISPTSGPAGTVVTITGTNFTGATAVAFADTTAASFVVNSSTYITAVLGVGGNGNVSVTTPNGTNRFAAFKFIPPATLTSFNPNNVWPGQTITITGTNLTSVTALTIGGAPATSYTINSPTSITAIVGNGTSGSIVASVGVATAKIDGLMFTSAPVVTAFSPGSGAAGTASVIITGQNFNTNAASNIVYFGATKAKVNAATAKQLTVTAPISASYQPLSVLNTGNKLTGYANTPFVTTFPSKNAIIPADFDAPQLFSSFDGLVQAITQDLDGDGKPDVVAVNRDKGILTAYRNTSTTGTISSSSFGQSVGFVGSGDPIGVTLGDLNGDGLPDMVVANEYANYITIYINNSTPGNISFQQPIDYTFGVIFANPSYINGISIADIDGDGRPEILAVTDAYYSKTMTIVPNLSTGGQLKFGAEIDLDGGSNGAALKVTDLDGDGMPDIVIDNSSGIVVYHNNSSIGTISIGPPKVVTPTQGSIAIADIDGDGKPDLVVTNGATTNPISIYSNTSTNGNISFAPKVDIAAGSPSAMAISDMDGDGKPDIVTLSSLNVQILRNTTAGTSISFAPPALINTNIGYTVSLSLCDIDGDGKTDIVVGNFGSPGDNFAVYRNDPQAIVYNPPPVITSFSPLSGPIGTTITIRGSNFNSTAANNIVFFGATKAVVNTATATQLTVTVPTGATYQPISVINTATNLTAYSAAPFTVTFPSKNAIFNYDFDPKVDITAASNASITTIADVDGDGKPDIVVSNASTKSISIFRNTATTGSITAGSFAPRVDISTGSSWPVNVVAGDINGDGKPDIIITGSNTVSVLRNTSTTGNISMASSIDLPFSGPVLSVSLADIDGDGRPELVVLENGNQFSIYRNTSVNGTIAGTSFVKDITIATSYSPSGLAVADMDGDGKPDIVIAGSGTTSGILSIYRNTSASGIFSFASRVDKSAGTYTENIALGDIDGDGKPDIIISESSGYTNNIEVFLNQSTPGVIQTSASKYFSTGSGNTVPAIADIDGDGKPDVVINSSNSSAVSILRNTSVSGTAAFATRVDLVTGNGPYAVSVADIDGDGKPDIVTPNPSAGTLSIIRNNPAATPPPTITSFTPTSALAGATVTITGTNFNGTTAVSFGGVNATSFIVNSATSISAVVGTGASGSVSVTTPGGTATTAGFTYLVLPAITSFTPTTAATATVVTITGTNFTGATAVKFGGTAAMSFSVISATSITAVVGNGANGNVSVTTPAGTGSLAGFNFVPKPTITAGGSTTIATGGSVALTASPGTGYSYQWLNNGTPITGATSATYTATQGGSYTVSITLNGVSQISAAITVTAVFVLPANTFTISANSATCHGSANGTISITAAQSLNYTATITGGSVNASYPFTTTQTINNLPAGTYNLCFTVTGQAAYQQCFTVVITEPKDLSVYAAVNNAIQSINLTLDGGGPYFITLNGVTTTTTSDNITLALNKGVNDVTVTTSKPCQGIYQHRFDLSGDVLAYPNPFGTTLNVSLGSDNIPAATIELYNTAGAKVYSKQFSNVSGILQINPPNLIPGVYMLKLTTSQSEKVLKVVKQ